MQSPKATTPAATRSERSGVPQLVVAVCVAAISMEVGKSAFAQTTSLLSNGPPVQVVPCVDEPGVPPLTITPGTANPFAGGDGLGGNGSGGTGGGGGGNAGDSDALSTMESTPWGLAAVSNASALGVNPPALAATCVVESTTCNSASQTGSYVGAFQMGSAAFQDGLKTALAADPSLATQIVQGPGGINDPTTQAIAASGYLMQAAQALQNAGISDPTAVQARGYYNFGPSAGTMIALASPTDSMSQYISPAVMQANGVTAGETVAQWQASVASKMGNAANQSILSS